MWSASFEKFVSWDRPAHFLKDSSESMSFFQLFFCNAIDRQIISPDSNSRATLRYGGGCGPGRGAFRRARGGGRRRRRRPASLLPRAIHHSSETVTQQGRLAPHLIRLPASSLTASAVSRPGFPQTGSAAAIPVHRFPIHSGPLSPLFACTRFHLPPASRSSK